MMIKLLVLCISLVVLCFASSTGPLDSAKQKILKEFKSSAQECEFYYQKILKQQSSKEFQSLFRESQSVWMEYRDSFCQTDTSYKVSPPKSRLYIESLNRCYIELNIQRSNYLKNLLTELEI